MTPEPNTPLVLGLDLLLGSLYGLLVHYAFAWRALGVYTRLLQLCMRILVVILPIEFVVMASDVPPADRPKMAAVLAGAAVSGVLAGRRAYRRRGRRPQRVLRRWAWPVDYLFGAFVYLTLIVGAGHAMADPSLAGAGPVMVFAVLFIVSQLSAQFLFALFSRAMRDDYAVSRGSHHLLVGVVLMAAVGADIVIGASPAGPIFSVLLLWASWRYTQQRPASTLKTLRYLRESRRAQRVPA